MNILPINIKGLEHYYVSDCGEVFDSNMKIKNKSLDKYGYFYSSFTFSKAVQKKIKIHRCVALTFLKNEQNKPTVNHKNGIKTDNNFKNLEFATHKEQTAHIKKNNLQKRRKGEECNLSQKIFVFNNKLEQIDICFGTKETAEKYNLSKSGVFEQLKKDFYTKKLKFYFRLINEKPKFRKPLTTAMRIKELISGKIFETNTSAQKELGVCWKLINKSLNTGNKIAIKRRKGNKEVFFHFVKI